MDMNARNQYLKVLQERYFMAKSRKDKSSILDEYSRNTHQNRKYAIRRIRSFSSAPKERKKRKQTYDGYVKAALAKLWEIFDYPCGQRLAPLLKTEVNRLRQLEEIFISNEVAKKLARISPATIDRKLKHQREACTLLEKGEDQSLPPSYIKRYRSDSLNGIPPSWVSWRSTSSFTAAPLPWDYISVP